MLVATPEQTGIGYFYLEEGSEKMKRNSVELIQKLTALFLCISLILTPSDLRQILNDSFRVLEMYASAEGYESDDTYADQSISAKGIVERNEDGGYSAVIESSGIRVAVSFTDEAGIPEGSVISLSEIVSDTPEYDELFEQSGVLIGHETDTNGTLKYARFFDITFFSEDGTIEPQAPVSVEIAYDRPDIGYDDSELIPDIVHFTDETPVLMETSFEQDVQMPEQNESINQTEQSLPADMLSFETDSFSAYGLIFYHFDDNNIGDALDGMTFSLVNFSKSEGEANIQRNVPALMGEYKYPSRLNIKEVEVYPDRLIDSEPDDFSNYVITDSDITQWTFTWISDNKYYITTQVDGVTKYLSLYSTKVKPPGAAAEGGKIELLDEPDEYSVITVKYNESSANNNQYKFRFVNKDNWALNLKGGNNNQGYQTYGPNVNSNQSTEWFVPAVLTDAEVKNGSILPPGEMIYTASKVSVSDTVNLTDGVEVVVYSKVWDSQNEEYVNYAINGSGELVKVWESGSVVQWKDDEDTSLYWQFIEYGDSGYYEFYNPVTGMYLAPQNGQLLSNSTIGVTLNGRANGEYTSTVEAWDEKVWSWYGYKYTDSGRLIPVPDTQSAHFCFAVKNEGTSFQPVETIDNKAQGITIKMFDYFAENDRSSLQTNIIGEKTFIGEGLGARTGLIENILNENGYPVATKTGLSLEPLFTSNDVYPEREANHLFIKSTFDETGYLEYSCFDNSAFLMKEDGSGATPSQEGYADVYDFTVYQELASPGKDTSKYSYQRGNFLPYDRVDNSDEHTKNIYSSSKIELSHDDPRYNEDIYVQTDVDYQFGMSLEATFMIPENGCDENGNPLIFEFTGDDDFWLFIDDVLVIDLGGIHNALTGSVNFKTGEVKTYNGYSADTYSYSTLMDCFEAAGIFPDKTPWDESKRDSYFRENGSFESNEGSFKDYSSHTMKIFYMERGAGASNLKLRFNLATVPENSIFLEKKLTGTQTTDYSNTKYAYQLYYRPAGSNEEYTLYENPVGVNAAHFEGGNGAVEYAETADINGTSYNSVFYIRAGEKAEFTMPSQEIEYYFVELGVLNQEYDYVNINNERAFNSDFSSTGVRKYEDVASSSDKITNRKRVIYENHIDSDYLKKLVITKDLVRIIDDEEVPVDDDKTGFEFQIYFLDEDGTPVPYKKGEYYVVDDDGNYYTFVGGQLSKHGKEKVVCSVSGNNGSIAGIPDGLSVVIENLLPTTKFKVEELPEKMPLGYEHLRYERVIDDSEATYHLIDSSVYNSGIIKENINAHMIVTNQKGFGITVKKDWTDEEYTTYHATIYIALFHKEGDGSLKYVDNTCRELISPNTTMYYFNSEEEANEYVAMEVIPETIIPADWSGNTSLVTDCQPYLANSSTSLNAETLSGETYEFEYNISYEKGEVEGTGHNIRTDSIVNSRDHLKILKQSMDGEPLIGAEFTLTDVTNGDVLLNTMTSDENGFITNAYLTAGHSYRLNEITAPNGYELLSGPVMIFVDENEMLTIQNGSDDNEKISFELSDSRKSGTLIIKNKPEGIIFRKTDTEGNPLSGAVFSIYQFDRMQNKKYPLLSQQNVVSDENGVFFGGSLNSGYYLIEEVKAPNGYAQLGESVVIHIRLADNAIDRLYTVRYDINSEKYITVKDVLDEWLNESEDYVRVDFPNKKISGNLIIRKTIDGIDASKGYPTFMFRVKQTKDENGNTIRSGPEYIRTISFDSSDIEPTKEIMLSDLPIGTYMVEELSSLNYTPSGVTVEGDSHPIISSNVNATVSLTTEDPVSVAFTNDLIEDGPPGYTAFADNKIRYPDSQNGEN